jgi:hypothetical protein
MNGKENKIGFGWQDAVHGHTGVPETGRGPPFYPNYKGL